MKTYKGIYRPNSKKYRGDSSNVVYRSHWEKQVMMWCDKNSEVVEWSSEEVVIPYLYEVDGRYHRYFVDFLIKYKSGKTVLVEVKPEKQTKPPKGKRRTKQYIKEGLTYVQNRNKWESASKFAEKRGWSFEIWTEVELKKMGILPKGLKPMKKMSPFRKTKKKS